MSLRTFAATTLTLNGVGDTSNFTANQYLALQGKTAGSTTAGARWRVEEIYLGGQSSASTVANPVLARDSTVGATLTALAAPFTDLPFDPMIQQTITNTVQSFTTATTQPQRSAQGYLLVLSLNTFGGVVRWVTSPNEGGIWGFGTAAFTYSAGGVGTGAGEMSLSMKNDAGIAATAVMGGHIIYEPY